MVAMVVVEENDEQQGSGSSGAKDGVKACLLQRRLQTLLFTNLSCNESSDLTGISTNVEVKVQKLQALEETVLSVSPGVSDSAQAPGREVLKNLWIFFICFCHLQQLDARLL
ncbi:hypothetical protein C5167_041548 [Papaver somniferum]|nr:hypothetical protein C5167_041548 [Papaver somniferum]